MVSILQIHGLLNVVMVTLKIFQIRFLFGKNKLAMLAHIFQIIIYWSILYMSTEFMAWRVIPLGVSIKSSQSLILLPIPWWPLMFFIKNHGHSFIFWTWIYICCPSVCKSTQFMAWRVIPPGNFKKKVLHLILLSIPWCIPLMLSLMSMRMYS